ncbi:MAG: serine/threonine protein kinase [Ardenticatenaceae bacterium]|nr:serine/threonine protein kinase [Anaerolineales bacterium]MCB8919941.1 serine/threonine protein kinase [Ardenticatenaceae bacterium]MCB8989788.1 serine/threonine protein kinase [Ardenticatenaceae bacterium]MCB9003964.1 serine/threonine protein kinase [Ardenticatenaceae bacterium]
MNNRYKLLERIGSGGMSVVYKAHDLSLGRLVAVKMLHESLTGDEGFLQRFQQEAHAAANLAHSNIVTVHDIGQDAHRHYIVMEFVDGRTLKQIIRQQNSLNQPMPINRALDLSIQICNGIGYAHRARLVHCDVKPQNILVTRDDRVKVADFGIARAVSEASQQQEARAWGTPQYFSPEQASGYPPTPASDVYAIGVILFEMLTGRLPFLAESHTAYALKHMNEAPPPITTLNTSIPPQLEQIVAKVLTKEPAGRYRTAGQLGRILSTYRQSSQDETGPVYPVTAVSDPATPIAERKTQLHQYIPPRLTDDQDEHTRPNAVIQQKQPLREATTHTPPDPLHLTTTPTETASPDWIAISLGITALMMLLGLIPLWYFVYRAWAG